MNKIFKKITAMVTAAAMAASITSTVFADFLIDDDQEGVSTTISNIKYYAFARSEVFQQQYNYLIKEQTTINAAINLFTNGSASRNVSNIYVAWQVVDYNSGADFGKKKEVDKTNTYTANGEEQISIYAPINKFTVFGAHTAYQNGSTIIAEYTTTHNFK